MPFRVHADHKRVAGSGVADYCESPNVGGGNETLLLWKMSPLSLNSYFSLGQHNIQ